MPVPTSATTTPALPRRADVEGLRAIAILLVIAAHAGVPFLQGGYIGVDVFFVISGFLITGLLHRELEETGRIQLPRFYARRLLRLFPALLVVTVVTCAAAFVLLAPFEHGVQAAGAMSALTWTSNFRFALEDLDYFSAGAQNNLFLHTWSLSLEEQFYLLWPLLLLYAARQSGTGAAPLRRFRTDVLTVGLLSLGVSLWLSHGEPRLGFYMVFSRAWQFAAGALVFLWFRRRQEPQRGNDMNRTVWTLVPAASLALIAGCAVAFGDGEPYPGWRALLPTIATALVIASGQAISDNPTARLLSSQPMVTLGGVSYSWYLWHWPVLLLGATLLPDPSAPMVALLALLSLGLAFVTRRLVEQPLRHALPLLRRPALVIASAAALACVSVLAGTAWSRAATLFATEPVQMAIEASRHDGAPLYADSCDQWFHSDELTVCPYGPSAAPKTVVILGDSAVAQWFSAVRLHYPEPTWRVLVITKSACPMVDAPFFYDRIGRRYTKCETWRERAIAEVVRLEPDVLVMGSSSGYPFDLATWRNGSARVLQRVVPHSGRTYLVAPLPIPAFDSPTCAARGSWRRRFGLDALCVSRDTVLNGAAIRSLLAQQATATAVTTVDLSEVICPGGWCQAVQNGIVMHRNSGHLTERQVLASARAFSERLLTP